MSKNAPPQISPHGVGSTQGTTYYVAPGGNDLNVGTTEAQPWKTIQKAANTLLAGDTVYIKAGTYEEQIIPQNSGSAGNIITYAAFPGDTVTIDGTSITLPPYETGLFVVEDRSYIKISGLRIINAGQNDPSSTADDNHAGIYVDNSHHVIIENNYTYNTVSSGIGVWDGTNIVIDGNEVRLACNDGEQEDITVSGTDTFEIKNNHIHEGGPGTNGGEGITVKGGATNGKIYKNHGHDITQKTCLYVDGWGGTKATSNIDIYQNIFHDCAAGITLSSEDGSLVRDIKIYNNIVYDNHSNGLEIGDWGEPGVITRPVEGITFTNNTVYHNGFGTWGGGFFNDNPDVKDIVVRNNIFSQNSVSQITNETTEATLTVDYNLIDGSQEYAYAITGTHYVTGDPLFVNVAGVDFHIQSNSPAVDSGFAVGAPTDDFDGNSRPRDGDGNGTNAHDIGAYEVTGVRPDNAVRLTTPPTGASDQNPAFSPDGSRLLFTRFENGYNTGPSSLFLLDLSNGHITRLIPWEDQDNVNLPGSAWNALNDRIAFASDRLERDDLWRIAPDGTDLSPITTHTGPPWYIEPSWSPDGQWIVFEADNNVPDDQQQGSIWKVKADGTGLTHLTDGPAGATDDRQPNWSPAGGRILFQRRVFPGGQWDIYTMLPDGSDVLNVTKSMAEETDASWSADGKWILFSTDNGGLPVPNIHAFSVASGQMVRVTSSITHEDGAPSWSPDGQWIAFESHEGQDEDTPTALWRIAAPQVAQDQLRVYLPLTLRDF